MRPPRIIIVLVLLLVTGLAVATWLLRPLTSGRSRQTIVFPNGTRVEVLGALRAGTMFTAEEAWARPLRRFLPQRWQGWLPSRVSLNCGGSSSNDISLFFESTAAGAAPMTFPWTWVAAVDDEGFRYPLGGGSCSTSSGTRRFWAVTLRGYPRRQKSFRVEFLDQNRQVLAQAQISNPLPCPPAETAWHPQDLPITLTNGELALTLMTARENTNRWGAYFQPQWKFESPDPGWRNPMLGSIELADPVGNVGGLLSRREPIWQLTAAFYRRRGENFDDADRLQLPNLALPAPGTMLPLSNRWEEAGVTLRPAGLFGAGTLFITNNLEFGMSTNLQTGWSTTSDGKTTVEQFGSLNPFFLLDVSGLVHPARLRFRLIDDQQRPIPLEGQNTYRSQTVNERRYQLGFAVTNAVQSLTLEILIDRPKVFVFHLNPAEVQPAPTKP